LRFLHKTEKLEALAGHRRLQAANNVRVEELPCRVVQMSDEEAYKFIRLANNYEVLTTAEKAYAVAEMDRFGFEPDTIREVMGNVGLARYLAVGRAINPDWFTDAPKKCDPSITMWAYALEHGGKHFRRCFEHWDAGVWDEEDCNKNFKRLDKALPPESYQRGCVISINRDGSVLRLRGTLDLSTTDWRDIILISEEFTNQLKERVAAAVTLGTFGRKQVIRYQPADEEDGE
jgi:hypothetical protein